MYVSRNLKHYWRSHVLIGLGIVVTTAVVVGSFLVGDMVRRSLGDLAAARLGNVGHLVVSEGRFFHQSFADDLQDEVGVTVAPMLRMQGMALNPNAEGGVERRLFNAAIYGIDARFPQLATSPWTVDPNGAAINHHVAETLGLAVGDKIVLRMPKPHWLPSEAPLSPDSDSDIQESYTVSAILTADQLGDFDLAANQSAIGNIYLPLAELQVKSEYPDQANLFAVVHDPAVPAARVDDAIRAHWQPADVGFEFLQGPNVEILRSKRIFIQKDIMERLPADSHGVFTYMVDDIAKGDSTTEVAPYAMVSAIDPALFALQGGPALPATWTDDGILLNQWLADDLGLAVGDSVTLRYKELADGSELVPASAVFTVQGILPLTGTAADRSLMPPFPGISGTSDCRDWDAGSDMDLDRIRPQDEQYWDEYEGTPKAFITLNRGQQIWTNRFGALTGVRFPAERAAAWKDELRANLDPIRFGLYAQDVKQRQADALDGSMDIGGLFMGLSFFLVLSGLLVTGLLVAFALTRRRREVGTLLAVGWSFGRVMRSLLIEHGIVALIGVVIGSILGIGYTALLVIALDTIWRDVIGGVALTFVLGAQPFIVGGGMVLVLAVLVVWLRVRGLRQDPVLDLLRGVQPLQGVAPRSRTIAWVVAAVFALITIGIIVSVEDLLRGMLLYFGAGFTLLVALLALVHALSGRWLTSGGARSLDRLAIANLGRRWGRSFTVIILLALASFLVLAVGAHVKHTAFDPADKTSGSGGFTMLMKTSLPIEKDLNTEAGRRHYTNRRGAETLGQANYVQMRVLGGDEASCRNLNQAQRPTLWGVESAALNGRFTFTGFASGFAAEQGWDVINGTGPDGEVLAVVDMNSLMWALRKPLGSTIEYRDEAGNPFTIKLVAQVADSTLQGGLVISEQAFLDLFPSKNGYNRILVDIPTEQMEAFGGELRKRFGKLGPTVVGSAEHLASFNQINNLYLAIFQVLGGLGLLLGSLGLVVILLRNVEERRKEFATLRAIGFGRARLLRMLVVEHLPLLLGGLGLGLVAAIVGVIPSFVAPGSGATSLAVIVLIILVAVIGLGTLWVAARRALAQPLLGDLRSE